MDLMRSAAINGSTCRSIWLLSRISGYSARCNEGSRPHRCLITQAHSTEGQPDEPIEETPKGPKKPTLLNILDIPAPHTGQIKVITLNSPQNKNAISRQLLGELRKQVARSYHEKAAERSFSEGKRTQDIKWTSTRAIVIASEVDGVFCAGADLKERKNMTENDTHTFLRQLRGTLDILAQLYIPTISAVSSVALGGGLELALATMFRVFTPATLVGLPETRLGIIPGAGGGPRLRALLGKTRALDLILTGRRIQGDEAFRIGLCDRLCGPTLEDIQSKSIGDDILRQSALNGALEMAREICEGGPATTYPTIKMMATSSAQTKEAAAYDEVLKTQDRDEALRAFAEKRKPVFQGR